MNKPDIFSSLFESTTKSHEPVLIKHFIGFSNKQIKIHQQSIFEYMQEKHDEDYSYLFFNTIEQDDPCSHPEIIIAYNPNNKIINIDNSKYFKDILFELFSINFINTHKTDRLNIQQNDTIMTVGYFVEKEQIFKIIYFGKTMKNTLIGSEI